jgi:hypothetical protein
MATNNDISPETRKKAKNLKTLGIVISIVAFVLVIVGVSFSLIQVLTTGDPFANGILGFMLPILLFMVGGMIALCLGSSLMRKAKLLELGWKPGQPYPVALLKYRPRDTVIVKEVVKEIVKIRCKFCGTLVENTVSICPNCGGAM